MTFDERFPLLVAAYEELKRFIEMGDESPGRQDGSAIAEPIEIAEGPVRTRFTYPRLGVFWLSRPQARVVDELIEARTSSGSPDVDQGYLIAASGLKVARLADVFKGSSAWLRLVIPGARPGTYRLAPISKTPDDAA